MLLQDLFDHISTLDSYSLNLDGINDNALSSEGYPKVIRAINLGLNELYKEFTIKENSVVIQLHDHITDYTIDSDYAETNTESTQPYKYIMDSAHSPFQDDLIKIERVYNEESFELPINDNRYDYSVYTPSYNVIQHPYPNSSNAIFVHYRAKHIDIPVDADPDATNVVIPPQILNLLLVWVNSKLLTTVNKQEAALKLTEYYNLLTLAKNGIPFRTDETANQKLEIRGWE